MNRLAHGVAFGQVRQQDDLAQSIRGRETLFDLDGSRAGAGLGQQILRDLPLLGPLVLRHDRQQPLRRVDVGRRRGEVGTCHDDPRQVGRLASGLALEIELPGRDRFRRTVRLQVAPRPAVEDAVVLDEILTLVLTLDDVLNGQPVVRPAGSVD